MQNRPFCIHLPPNSRTCMQNRAFCIHLPTNRPTCMQNRDFCIHPPPNSRTCMQNRPFCIHPPPNRPTCMQNRPFCIHLPPNHPTCMQNRAFCIHFPPNRSTCMQNRSFCIQNASLCIHRGWRQMIQRGRQKAREVWLQQPDVPAGDQIAVQDEEDFQGLAAGGIGDVIAAQALVLEYEFVLTEFQSRITD